MGGMRGLCVILSLHGQLFTANLEPVFVCALGCLDVDRSVASDGWWHARRSARSQNCKNWWKHVACARSCCSNMEDEELVFLVGSRRSVTDGTNLFLCFLVLRNKKSSFPLFPH